MVSVANFAVRVAPVDGSVALRIMTPTFLMSFVGGNVARALIMRANSGLLSTAAIMRAINYHAYPVADKIRRMRMWS